MTRRAGASSFPRDLVAGVRTGRPTSSGSPTRCAPSGATRASEELDLDGARRARPAARRGSRFSFDAQRPALVARGLSEAENELAGLLRQGLDVVVAFAHRGEAERRRSLLRRVEAELLEPGAEPAGPHLRGHAGPARLRLARPRARAAARHAGLPPPPAARDGAGRPRARELLRPAQRRLRRPRGPRRSRSCSASRRRRSPGVTRDYLLLGFRGEDRVYVPHEQIGKVSRYIGADSQRAGALQARRQGLGQPQEPRPRSTCARWPASCSQLYAERQTRPGIAYDLDARVARAARGRLPLPRDRGPGARRSRRSRRTSRRRGRWTASSAATSASARPRWRCARRSPSPSPASRC